MDDDFIIIIIIISYRELTDTHMLLSRKQKHTDRVNQIFIQGRIKTS